MQIFRIFKTMFPSMTLSPHEKLFRLFLYTILVEVVVVLVAVVVIMQ
jgi:hypothetical protein